MSSTGANQCGVGRPRGLPDAGGLLNSATSAVVCASCPGRARHSAAPARRLTYPGDLSRGTTSATRDFRTIVWRITQLGFNAVRLPFTFAHFADAPAPTGAPCYAETAVRPSPPLCCGPFRQSQRALPHVCPCACTPCRPGAALAMAPPRPLRQRCRRGTRGAQASLDLSVTPPANLPAFNATTLPTSGAAAPPQTPPVLPAGLCNAGMPTTSTRDRYLWVVQYLIDEGLCAALGGRAPRMIPARLERLGPGACFCAGGTPGVQHAHPPALEPRARMPPYAGPGTRCPPVASRSPVHRPVSHGLVAGTLVNKCPSTVAAWRAGGAQPCSSAYSPNLPYPTPESEGHRGPGVQQCTLPCAWTRQGPCPQQRARQGPSIALP
jgi:hypothetical protein